jgi:conjugal transfer/entry exclusion protein
MNIDLKTDSLDFLQEYAQVVQDINNALDEFYDVLPDIKITTGDDRKETLEIWQKHTNDLKDSCQQIIDEIDEKIREINF